MFCVSAAVTRIMGSGLLRELELPEKSFLFFFCLGGGLRDGSGCANLLGSKTHGLGSARTTTTTSSSSVVVVS